MTYIAYDATLPFPDLFAAEEFGRAWVDSLYHNDRATYNTMKAAGALQANAEQIEEDAQERFRLMLGPDGSRCPAGLLPHEWLTQGELAAREVVMESVRLESSDAGRTGSSCSPCCTLPCERFSASRSAIAGQLWPRSGLVRTHTTAIARMPATTEKANFRVT